MDTKLLKQKILDLAIRGKLVPQDPNDEPASVLLERIRAEREKLIAEGKLKRSKKTSDNRHYENNKSAPFEIPVSWEWCKVDDFACVASGSTPEKSAFVEKGIPYLKMYNLKNQKIDFDFKPQYIKEEVHNGKLQRSRTEVGDLIMNIVGPPLGKLAIIPSSLPQCNFNQAAVLIRPYAFKDILVKYLFYYLSQMSEIDSISTRGSAGQVNISLTQAQNMRVPMPPLAEQKRIIAEITHWFSLIDEIESNKQEILEFIDQAKSKVLDLAIHGKLVPQDPSDEPAIELLKRINPNFVPCDTSHYGKLPQSWCVVKLGDIGKWQAGGTPKRSIKEYYGGDIPWLKTGDLNDGFITDIPEYITQAGLDNSSAKLNPKGSIMVAMYGATIGKIGILTFPAATNQACCACIDYPAVDIMYLFYFLLSHRDKFIAQGGGGAQPNISKEIIVNTYTPLPPLAEQKRIAQKVMELFAILDGIMEKL